MGEKIFNIFLITIWIVFILTIIIGGKEFVQKIFS